MERNRVVASTLCIRTEEHFLDTVRQRVLCVLDLSLHQRDNLILTTILLIVGTKADERVREVSPFKDRLRQEFLIAEGDSAPLPDKLDVAALSEDQRLCHEPSALDTFEAVVIFHPEPERRAIVDLILKAILHILPRSRIEIIYVFGQRKGHFVLLRPSPQSLHGHKAYRP